MRLWGMRKEIVVKVTVCDRKRLAVIVADRNSPQKHDLIIHAPVRNKMDTIPEKPRAAIFSVMWLPTQHWPLRFQTAIAQMLCKIGPFRKGTQVRAPAKALTVHPSPSSL
jgi:hypothetical protein